MNMGPSTENENGSFIHEQRLFSVQPVVFQVYGYYTGKLDLFGFVDFHIRQQFIIVKIVNAELIAFF